MFAGNLFIALVAVSLIWYIVATVRIMDYVQKKGVKVNWFLIRMLLFSYVGKYRILTREETGKTGPWFFHFVIAINAALVFAVIAILFRKGVLY